MWHFQPSALSEQWGPKFPPLCPYLLSFSLNMLTASSKEPLIPIWWARKGVCAPLSVLSRVHRVLPTLYPSPQNEASGFTGPPYSQSFSPFLWTCRPISQLGKLRLRSQKSHWGLSDFNVYALSILLSCLLNRCEFCFLPAWSHIPMQNAFPTSPQGAESPQFPG